MREEGQKHMRNIALLGLGAFVAMSFAGAALADTMTETYGNTLLATNDKGETTKVWFKADNTFTSQDSKGVAASGKWVVREGKYCSTLNLAADAPAGTVAPKESCIAYEPNHKVGEKWAQKDADAKTMNVEIKKGM
jgi:hypothetical protein